MDVHVVFDDWESVAELKNWHGVVNGGRECAVEVAVLKTSVVYQTGCVVALPLQSQSVAALLSVAVLGASP